MIDHNPRISAVLVNWNRCELLKEAIDSLRNQNYPNMEYIVIDNGSTDDSINWLQSQTDIIVIENSKNQGASAARNQGIRQAEGEYLLFLDSDAEVLTQNSLQGLIAVMEEQSNIAGAAGGIYSDREARQIWCYSPCTDWEGIFDPVASTTFLENPPALSTCFSVFRRSCLEEIGGFDESFFYLFEDGDLCERLKKRGYGFYLDPEIKVYHKYAEPGRAKQDEIQFHYYHEQLRFYYVLKNWGLKRFLSLVRAKLAQLDAYKKQFPYLPLLNYIDIYFFRAFLLLIKFPYVRLLRKKNWLRHSQRKNAKFS
ncbi:glycosyltransferase [bacterium]|nr:glycosyltransferase [bacterium]